MGGGDAMIVGVKCLAVWESASSYLSFVVIVKGWASNTDKTNCSCPQTGRTNVKQTLSRGVRS